MTSTKPTEVIEIDPAATPSHGAPLDATQSGPRSTAAQPPPVPVPSPLDGTGPVTARLQAAVLAAVMAAAAAGGGFAWGGAGAAATETDLDKLEAKLAVKHSDLADRVTNLEPLVKVAQDAYEMSALALEISVESHRYQADLIVDVAQLIDPTYMPPDEDPRLRKRLRQGTSVIDAIGISQP